MGVDVKCGCRYVTQMTAGKGYAAQAWTVLVRCAEHERGQPTTRWSVLVVHEGAGL